MCLFIHLNHFFEKKLHFVFDNGMKNAKLILLLRSFSGKEIEELRLFFNSPFHVSDRRVVELFDLLAIAHPDFSKKQIDKETLWTHLFPERAFQDLVLRRLISSCLKTVENWLLFKNQYTSRAEQQLSLAAYYRQTDLQKHRVGALRNAAQALEKADPLDADTTWHQYRFNLERETPEAQRQGKSQDLLSVSQSLDTFYLVHKLKYACILLNQQNVYQQEFQLELLEEVLTHLQQKSYDSPLLNLYHLAILTLIHPQDPVHFTAFQALLTQHNLDLPRKEGEHLHALARNYCIRQSNFGDASYLRRLFELYQLALASGLLVSESRELSSPAFKNIVLAGLRLKEFDWVEQFIRDFSPLLPKPEREDFLHFNLARVFFEKGDYSKAIPLLGQVGERDLFLQMDTRALKLKTWYALDEPDLVESGIAGFKMLIRRNKMLAYHRKNYQNFLKSFKALIHVNRFDAKAVTALRTKIEATAPLTEKNWFLNVIDEQWG